MHSNQVEEQEGAPHGAELIGVTAGKLPTRIITYAWGDSYLNDLLSLTIPALLAPGNLPYVASQVSCEVVLLTEERFFDRVREHPAIVALRQHCRLRLIGLDDLISSRGESYGMALTYALHRGFADLGPTMTDSWQIFLNADFVLADGCLRNLMVHLQRGERIVAAPSYCAIAHEVKPELLKRVDTSTWTLSMMPREMAKLTLQHRHPINRCQTVNQDESHIEPMHQFYWLADENTLIGYQMPVAIVGMRPERYVAEPNSYWDHGLMEEYCPHTKPKVIGDSDEFMMIELRDSGLDENWIKRGRPEADQVGNAMISWLTPYQHAFTKSPITLHAAELPADIEDARRDLDSFVNDVFLHFSRFLPSHRDHPQWLYHRSSFARKRHEFLSRRLGMMTARLPAPNWLLELDRDWWALDSARKRKAEKRAVLERQLQILEQAADGSDPDVARELADVARRFIGNASLSIEARSLPTQITAFSTQMLGESANGGKELLDENLPLKSFMADFDSYERECATIFGRQNELQQEIIYYRVLYQQRVLHQQRVRELDQEFEPLLKKLEDQYERAITRVKSAAIPIVRTRTGPSPRGPAQASLVTRLAEWLYGKWPWVRRTSPFWSTLRHLLPIVDFALKQGARDALLVGDRTEIINAIVNLPGEHAWVSVAGLKTGNLARAFEQPPQFDLCICDLEYSDIVRFSEIFSEVHPLMRAGGTIVGIHVAADGPTLYVDHAAVVENLRKVPDSRLYYAGSAESVKAVHAYRRAGSNSSRLMPYAWAQACLGLALAFSRTLRANRIEAQIPDGSSADPGGCTSVTIAAKLPAFEGDDGTLQYSKSCGIYIVGVEAPVFEEHIITSNLATQQTPTVILVLGDSNAANHGGGHYAAKGSVHIFNVFDMKYYRAIDPLPGASHDGASIWGRVGDKLLGAGFRSVLFVPIALAGMHVRDWVPGGRCFARLAFALHRVKMAGLKIDLICWQQGATDANQGNTSAASYQRHFLTMLEAIRKADVRAPIFVALSSLGEAKQGSSDNRAEIRLAQKRLIAYNPEILPGPDIDHIGLDHRDDGWNYLESGVELAAQNWFEAINSGPDTWRVTRAKYRKAIRLRLLRLGRSVSR